MNKYSLERAMWVEKGQNPVSGQSTTSTRGDFNFFDKSNNSKASAAEESYVILVQGKSKKSDE